MAGSFLNSVDGYLDRERETEGKRERERGRERGCNII